MEAKNLLFQNERKTKGIPGDQEWKGYSAYAIGDVTHEQENPLEVLKAITSVVPIQKVLEDRNSDF